MAFAEQARLEMGAAERPFDRAILWLVASASERLSRERKVRQAEPSPEPRFKCYLEDSSGRLVTENGRFVPLDPWTGERIK